MTYEKESELLSQFIDEADGGRITDVSAIKAAYDKKDRARNWAWADILRTALARMDEEDAQKQASEECRS